MKKLLTILTLILAFGCNEDAPNCFKSAGSQVVKTIDLPDFNRLYINNEFNVILTQGVQQNVNIRIGENLFSEVDFVVIDGELIIKDNISCRWVRKYDFPVIEITHPNISEIEITGGSVVSSTNTLNYPSLTLRSKDTNGDYNLNINSNTLTVWNNGISNFAITGNVTDLTVSYTSGDGRFEGANLLTTNASVYHNGTNAITVNVSNELKGNINSTGDLVFVGSIPTYMDVTVNGRGNLINGTN
jgi:hypothetical protein